MSLCFGLGPGLQLVLDDSERLRLVVRDFGAVLDDICSVCNMSRQKERLHQSEQQVQETQRSVLEQLQLLLQAVQVKRSASRLGHRWMVRLEVKMLRFESDVSGGGGGGRGGEDLGEQCC